MSEHTTQPNTHERKSSPWDVYPNPEDWDALQGGKPRVFYNPNRPSTRWLVLHVYDEHEQSDKRFRNGTVVETAPPDPSKIPFSRLNIRRKDEEGKIVDRDIMVPSLMVINLHGNPCDARSAIAAGSEPYKRIQSQGAYVDFINAMRNAGMTELRYGIQEDQLRLIPMQIRDPRPLN